MVTGPQLLNNKKQFSYGTPWMIQAIVQLLIKSAIISEPAHNIEVQGRGGGGGEGWVSGDLISPSTE